MMDFPLTLPALLRHTERLHRNREIVSRCADRSLRRTTYGECLERSRKLGAALRKLGLHPGDRVATFCWTHDRHLELYFGVPAAGFVNHTLNIRLHADDLAYIATHADDRVAIVDKSLWPAFEKFRARAPFEHVIVVTDDGAVPDGTIDYEDFIRGETAEPFADIADEHTAAAMCYTSGTTGKPKGVVYSHRSQVLHSMCIASADVLALAATECVLPVVPMFHANAWGIPYAAAMTGAKLVFPGQYLDAASVVELLAKERVTVTAGVPTIWMGILDYLDKQPGVHDLSRLRSMLVGGSAVPESLIRAMLERHGLRVQQGWGMTETSPLGSFTNVRAEHEAFTPGEHYAYRATQGMPAPFVETRARNESGEVPWDGYTMGELEVRGPWVAAAYYESEEAADKFTPDGWFRTGDIVTIAPDGHLVIQDRSKDLVKSGGEWISSVALESFLMDHPDVAEAAVVAVAHPKWAERPLAIVVPRAGRTPTAESLKAHLASKFASWWLPDAYEIATALPRTPTGKVRKNELREQYAMRYTQEAAPVATPEVV
jgi:fatty-acyl-CoA synthase